MTNPTIETDIAEILKKLGDNQEKILEKIGNIDSRLVRVETRLESILPVIKEDIKDIKESQKILTNNATNLKTDIADLKGAKSLVIPIVVAVTTSIVTLLIRAIPIAWH